MRRCDRCDAPCPDEARWWLFDDGVETHPHVICDDCAPEFADEDLLDPDEQDPRDAPPGAEDDYRAPDTAGVG